MFIRIMKGDFDAKLHWPIRHKYTFILFNQVNSKDNLVHSYEITKENLERCPNSFERPIGNSNISFGSASILLNEKYCKQDSIIFHISVEVLPPL